MPRRPVIPQRIRVFLGCEGESERSYGALLQYLADSANPRIPVYIHAVPLNPGAGDPLAMIQRACRCAEFEEGKHGRFEVRAILLDADVRGRSPDRDAEAVVLARTHRMRLIWQDPNHEAFLLRHLPGCRNDRPPAGDAMGRLQKEWPTYRKGLSRMDLALRIRCQDVKQVCGVEPDLCAFLAEIGFPVGSV